MVTAAETPPPPNPALCPPRTGPRWTRRHAPAPRPAAPTGSRRPAPTGTPRGLGSKRRLSALADPSQDKGAPKGASQSAAGDGGASGSAAGAPKAAKREIRGGLQPCLRVRAVAPLAEGAKRGALTAPNVSGAGNKPNGASIAVSPGRHGVPDGRLRGPDEVLKPPPGRPGPLRQHPPGQAQARLPYDHVEGPRQLLQLPMMPLREATYPSPSPFP